MTMMKSVIAGVGGYLPSHIMTNDEIAKRVDTSDEWIKARTGISQRHIAAEGEYTSDLATHAAKAALLQAGFSSVDYVEVRSPNSLTVLKGGYLNGPARILVAAHCPNQGQSVRLIDNFAV